MWKQKVKQKKFFFYSGLLMLLSEIWKQWSLTYLVNGGTYDWWYFPFQLCSIPMYICLLLPWVTSFRLQNVFLIFLMDFGMLGGIFTFFDTSGLHYSYFPLTVHSFVWHVFLIFLGVYSGSRKEVDRSWKFFAGSVLFFLLCCLMATLFNLLFHSFGKINMFYINPYYSMAQIVFCRIAEVLGNEIGILVYIGSIIVGAGILHVFWRNLGRKSRMRSSAHS